jgi:carbonic anhydrase
MARGKSGLNQSVTWIFAFLIAAAIFIGLYLITDYVNSQASHQRRKITDVDKPKPESTTSVDADGVPQPARWSYKGSEGPDHWGDISDQYSLCRKGKKQSPINLTEAKTVTKLLPLKFVYRETELSLFHNGHTIQGNYGEGSHIEIEGDIYDLIQFHFHTPSEHQEDGIQYDGELHLVHKNKFDKLAVVGIFIEEGKASQSLARLWKDLPKINDDRAEPTTINMASILPKRRRYYHYMGSLTTPPCSEKVSWYVLKAPIQMSSQQIDKLVRILKYNARPVQSIQGRRLQISTR